MMCLIVNLFTLLYIWECQAFLCVTLATVRYLV